MPAGGDRDGEAALDATLPRDTDPDPAPASALAPTQLSTGGGGATRPLPTIERGKNLGRYLVLDLLGSGTMGVVVSAYDPTLDRKVAIKLVRPDVTGSSVGRQRLLREAQAMARLSHPNVVTVFEVGTVDDQVFLAMEYVPGTTLAEWYAAPGRTQREILAALVAAGRGLAAAHRAGIVHRDFKPANVLVDADGQVRVADFGLATGDLDDADTITRPSSLTGLSMTATGAVLGTPAYMAPEQHRGVVADARADQFAFCVALHEALCRQLPFAGDDYPTYSSHVLAGELREPPRGVEVPARVRRAILRGLAVDPAKRHPGMSELLAELERDPTASRRRTAIAAAAAVGALALTLAGGGLDDDDPCAAAAPSLTGVWDADVRHRIETGFAAISPAAGPGIAARIGVAFDGRARELATMRRDACAATHVRHEQSAALLDRRMQCLDMRTAELGALAQVLAATPDARVLEGALAAALSLPTLAACADRARLLAEIAPPDDPTVRVRVRQLDHQLATAKALASTGTYAEALAVADAATTSADALGYVPLRARAHHIRALVLAKLEKGDQAVVESQIAGELAAQAHDDFQLARIWVQLYALTGSDLSRPREALAMEPLIAAAVVRGGNEPETRANLDQSRGAIQIELGDYAAAAESFFAAERGLTAALGPRHSLVGNALANAATALTSAGRYDDARAAYDRAMAIATEAFGPDDPHVARVLNGIGTLADVTGHPDQALDYFRRALAIEEKVLPAGHARLASFHDSIAVQLDRLGRLDESLAEHQRALAILETDPTNNAQRLANAVSNLAVTQEKLGDGKGSLASYRRALAILEALRGPDHPDVADTLDTMGVTLLQNGDAPGARAVWQRALAIRIAKLGENHIDTALTYGFLGTEAMERGAYREALGHLDHAIAAFDKVGVEHAVGYVESLESRGQVRVVLRQHAAAVSDFARARDGYLSAGRREEAGDAGAELAEAQWAAGGAARDQALASARTALELLVAEDAKPKAAALRAWITKHGGR